MSKTMLFILAGFIVIIVGGAVTFFIFSKMYESKSLPSSNSFFEQNTLTKPATREEEVVYEDSSGISFRHFASMPVVDVTPADDDRYYTSLLMKGNGAEVSVWAMDTQYKSVAEWIKVTPPYQGARLVGAASLGGVGASQYSYSDKILTATVDQGILYVVEAPSTPQGEAAHDLLVSSFTFGKAPAPATGGSGGGNVTYEEEEVVE